MEESYKRIQSGRLSLIMMIFFTIVNAIATHGLILYHLVTAYREFKQHPEAVEIPKVKHT